MDSSVSEESENFDSFSENEYTKRKCNTPTNISTTSSNIVYKLFNREVSVTSYFEFNMAFVVFLFIQLFNLIHPVDCFKLIKRDVNHSMKCVLLNLINLRI